MGRSRDGKCYNQQQKHIPVKENYKRADLMDMIPVDENGNPMRSPCKWQQEVQYRTRYKW